MNLYTKNYILNHLKMQKNVYSIIFMHKGKNQAKS